MFTATITPDIGEPFQVTATSRDVVRWERADPRRNSLGSLGNNASMTAITSLLFHAAKRQGLFDGTPEAWEDGVDVDLHDQDEDGSDGADSGAGPTRRAR